MSDLFDTQPTDTWQRDVEAWPWKSLGSRAWRKHGKCPRCKHDMTVDYTVTIIANLLPSIRRPTKRKVLARCNCSEEHRGHPADPRDGWGCGQAAPVSPPGDA